MKRLRQAWALGGVVDSKNLAAYIVRSMFLMFHMTLILIKLVFRTFLYYLINWNYLVCDSVLLSQTEWVISTYCWLGRSALSDIRASPQLGHLAQDAAHCRPLCGICDTAPVSVTPLSRPVYKRVAEWLVLFLFFLPFFFYRSFV